jgi:hypothetical protein
MDRVSEAAESPSSSFREQELVCRYNDSTTTVLPTSFFQLKVERVQNHANNKIGGHQELRCTLENGVCVRISRTNGVDVVEFQYQALEAFPYILDDYVFAMPPTFQTIYEIFLRIRSEIPRYDQGNCVVLTQRILNAIDPKFYATENEEADLYGF